MKVVLVDDSAAMRASFGGLISAIPSVELVGCAEDVASALSTIDAQDPDLVVLDVALRNGELGIDILRQVMSRRPGQQVIVLSNFTWQAMRSQLLEAGAAAYFDKADQFIQARDWIAARAARPSALLEKPPP